MTSDEKEYRVLVALGLTVHLLHPTGECSNSATSNDCDDLIRNDIYGIDTIVISYDL